MSPETFIDNWYVMTCSLSFFVITVDVLCIFYIHIFAVSTEIMLLK